MNSFTQFKSYLRNSSFKLFAAISVTLIILSFGYSYFIKSTPSDQRQIVAITQIASHPSLDLIRKGITDELKTGNYQVEFQNAQGNVTTATQIAHKFVGMKPAVIVAITTPSAQSVKNAIKNTDIKMVFSAVTDPIGARLLNNFIDHSDQVTGTVDLPPIGDQLKMILKYKPNTKRIGVIYNPGEINSIQQINKLKEIAEPMGIDVIMSPANKSVEVGAATARLAGVIDAIYVPNDNTVASAIESLIKIADQNKILVLASEGESIEKGATIALANNQYEVGRDTGKIVLQILNGQKVSSIPVKETKAVQLFVNKEKLKMLGLVEF